jgi:hypothetical protein
MKKACVYSVKVPIPLQFLADRCTEETAVVKGLWHQ